MLGACEFHSRLKKNIFIQVHTNNSSIEIKEYFCKSLHIILCFIVLETVWRGKGSKSNDRNGRKTRVAAKNLSILPTPDAESVFSMACFSLFNARSKRVLY